MYLFVVKDHIKGYSTKIATKINTREVDINNEIKQFYDIGNDDTHQYVI